MLSILHDISGCLGPGVAATKLGILVYTMGHSDVWVGCELDWERRFGI